MKHHFFSVVVTGLISFAPVLASAAAVKTEVVKTDTGWQLLREGQPYFILGAGGDASKQKLKDLGGNSFRTWGADDIGDKLDEAHKLGLSVTVGIWLGHERHGFNYSDAKQVKDQFNRAKAAVEKYKDHPAVLMWSVGNEMEGFKDGDNPAIWAAVQNIAAMIKRIDPNHPTMTVVAEIGGGRIESIHDYCPDIDVVGINTYGGGPSIAERYRQAGGTKPFVVTEFGPAGTWEVGKNAWDVPLELTSTAKADSYRATYVNSIEAEKGKLSLGSYAFAWGAKQEATATWYGIFLADGTRLEAMDTLGELWSGHKPDNRCPQIKPLKFETPVQVEPGATVRVTLDVTDPENDALTTKWVLSKDPAQYQTGGDAQIAPPTYPEAIVSGDAKGAEIKMPTNGGGYWLYAYVYDGKGGAAMANAPLRVLAPEVTPKIDSQKASLPFIVYADDMKGLPYVWSGWMGNHAAIGMDEASSISPNSGARCMKLEYRANDGFGGIVWQSPANDWGDAAGGFNLTGAKKLTFFARGEAGGEAVNFAMGVIGKDKKFPDSGSGELDNVVLTKEWKQYEIDLSGKDLSCIKTGFVWIVNAKGKPVTFYLDDIKYE